MTDPRRSPGAEEPRPEATRVRDLNDLRTSDVPLNEFVAAGGFRGLTASDMFPVGGAA